MIRNKPLHLGGLKLQVWYLTTIFIKQIFIFTLREINDAWLNNLVDLSKNGGKERYISVFDKKVKGIREPPVRKEKLKAVDDCLVDDEASIVDVTRKYINFSVFHKM